MRKGKREKVKKESKGREGSRKRRNRAEKKNRSLLHQQKDDMGTKEPLHPYTILMKKENRHKQNLPKWNKFHSITVILYR